MRKNLWLIPMLMLAVSCWARQTANNPPAPMSPPNEVAVSAGVMAGNRIGGQMPQYPAIAKAAGIQGTVVLRATISREGKVTDLQVVSGPPMLQSAALAAVRTWTYKPYLLNGRPVDVETQVNVVFSLGSLPPAATAQAAPDFPPPEHPVTADQVRELMDLSGMTNLQKQLLAGMMPTLRSSMPPYMPDDVLDDFQNSVVGSDMEEAVVKSYQAHMSTEDATAAIEFYKTPAGQRILAETPVIMRELQVAGGQIGIKVLEEVIERHKAEIEAAKQRYEQSHPWSTPKN